MYEERYGKNFIPADMTIQDWGITYDELEPYYDKFEYTAAVSGKAGNIKGQIQAGGNPFEAPRARDYPLPPLTPILASEMFTRGREEQRLSPVPAAVGQRLARLHQSGRLEIRRLPVLRLLPALRLRGQRQGQRRIITVIPIAMRNPNFELRTHSWVTKVLKDSDGKRVTGVTYTNVLNGEEFEQPAAWCCCAPTPSTTCT